VSAPGPARRFGLRRRAGTVDPLKVVSAEFVTSAAAGGSASGIPADGLPQIAMTGRSNVGKSMLLNALCRRKVARTSAAPGKTRLANIYRVALDSGGPGPWRLYLVDLPGYGYARGGADAAAELREVAEAYFASAGRLRPERGAGGEPAGGGPPSESERGWGPASTEKSGRNARDTQSPIGALLLVDARHPGLASDVQAAGWLAAMQVAHRIVATKIDKLSRSERARNLKTLETTFGIPPLAVSATSGEGMDTLWKTIASLARTGA
jgi:GTP-binding protein